MFGWEPERLAAMHDVISAQERPVVFDVGAEEGDLPALWASWGADVVLVEPNPRVWPNVRFIFQANQLQDRVRGWFVGFAGDEPRDRPAWDWEHVGHETPWPRCAFGPLIGDHGFLVLPERPDCPVTTLDALAARHGPPTVVTIDVEGAELTVLRGAQRILAEARPDVFVSIHIDLPWIDEKYPGDTGDKVREFMEAFDYVEFGGKPLAIDHEEHVWFSPEERIVG